MADLTTAERVITEILFRRYDSEYDTSHLSAGDFATEARELLAAARPHIAAEALREAAAWLDEHDYWTAASEMAFRANRIEQGKQVDE